MTFDFNTHKNLWIFGIDFLYSKYNKAFYLHFVIWSIGFFKVKEVK